jgi:hypothetical protein
VLRHGAHDRGSRGEIESAGRDRESVFPDRAATLRPNNQQELKATTVVTMRIEDASAKVRDKGVVDDEEDYALPIWASVIPVRMVVGAEQPCSRLLDGVTRPDGLAGYRDGRRLDETLLEAQHRYERDGTRD